MNDARAGRPPPPESPTALTSAPPAADADVVSMRVELARGYGRVTVDECHHAAPQAPAYCEER
ncbi:hypothetical protein OHJ16_03955 [Actinomyces israelii]|uniref:Uncharacterized protein n=1 Tax=Actinomyces israelii TaxID=1659 RepID=A0ABT4I649_9ACTO|nr:hypothetical protein [Actinomyces israelii]MCZ0857195.1 hypothetical protein [Actinomyces israelii]